MKASSSAKLIWETYHFIRSLFLFSLSLVFPESFYARDTFPSSSSLLHPWLFSRLVKKRRISSLLVVLRFPFPVLSRQVLRESLLSILYPLFSSQWPILLSSISRYTCLHDECAIYLTHKPALIFNYKCEN